MPNTKLTGWRQAYREALVELDPQKLREKTATVEAMIFPRLRSLDRSPEGSVERGALNDALCHLRLFSLEESDPAELEWE